MSGCRSNVVEYESLKELMEDLEEIAVEMDDDFDQVTSNNYSHWMVSKNTYYPSIDNKKVDVLDPGVYRLILTDSGYACIKQDISSDELILLPDSLHEQILKDIDKFWERGDKFKHYNLVHKRGILLEGPPGTGKSGIITQVCQSVSKKQSIVFLVNSIKEFTYIYEFLPSVFRKIEPNTHVITIIEDINQLFESRIDSEILDFFDGKSSIDHHLIICTANDTTNLPESLLRPSRIDKNYIVDTISDESRREFFVKKGVTVEDIDIFVELSKEFTIAEMKEFFIGVYVLGNSIEETVESIQTPFEKRNYSDKSDNKVEIDM